MQSATALAAGDAPLRSQQRNLLATKRPPPPKKGKKKPPPPPPRKRRPPPPKRRPPPPKKVKPAPLPTPSPEFEFFAPPPPRAARTPTPVPDPPFPCTLTIDGTAHTFKTCFETRAYTDVIGAAFYTLEGTTLKVGFRAAAPEAGWASWGYLPSGGMIAGNAVFALTEGENVYSGAYQMNGYSSALFTPATVAFSEVAVGRDGALLAGMFEMQWPAGASEITMSMAWGSMGAGRPQVHRFIPRAYDLNKKTLRHTIPPEL